jgi:HPt (histidine-containing phosphotransfer) domain-containing protein
MSEKSEPAAEKIQAMLQVMWKNSRATIAERTRMLRNAQEKLAKGAIDDRERKEAESAAHKLAGILGTFGLPQGTALASKIENLLASADAIKEEHQQELAALLEDLEAQIASKDR